MLSFLLDALLFFQHPPDGLCPEINEVLQVLLEVNRGRHTIYQRDVACAEIDLQVGFFMQELQHHISWSVFLQLHNNPHILITAVIFSA